MGNSKPPSGELIPASPSKGQEHEPPKGAVVGEGFIPSRLASLKEAVLLSCRISTGKPIVYINALKT